MTPALTKKQAAKLATEAELKQVQLQEREDAALQELRQLGGRVVLYEASRHVEEDELRGIKAQFVPGVCNVIFTCATDALKRKSVTGISAVHALDEARGWLRYQERLKPEFRFQVALEPMVLEYTESTSRHGRVQRVFLAPNE